MVLGQLRVSVIGAQTQSGGVQKPYTVYRTAVNFRGQCYQRLIRFSQFYHFHKKLHLRDSSLARHVVFPGKEWTRNASLQEDVVEARQVLLNEYMDSVTTYELTPGCYDRLLRLLKVGDYDTEPARGHPVPHKPMLASMHSERSEVDAVTTRPEDETVDKLEQQEQRRHVGGGVNPARAAQGATDHIGGGVNPARAAQGATDHIGGVATLVNTSVVFRSAPSSAETVLTDDDERGMLTSGSVVTDDEQPQTDTDDDLTDDSFRVARVAASDKAQRPHLRTSASTPAQQRVKKVQFHVRTSDGSSTPKRVVRARAPETDSGDISPERKYRSRIEKQMSNIETMLSRYSGSDGKLVVPPEFAQPSSGAASRSQVECA